MRPARQTALPARQPGVSSDRRACACGSCDQGSHREKQGGGPKHEHQAAHDHAAVPVPGCAGIAADADLEEVGAAAADQGGAQGAVGAVVVSIERNDPRAEGAADVRRATCGSAKTACESWDDRAPEVFQRSSFREGEAEAELARATLLSCNSLSRIVVKLIAKASIRLTSDTAT
jgi:hypothetical protein